MAIKLMLEQDLTEENTEDFCNEISLLRCNTPPYHTLPCEVAGTVECVPAPEFNLTISLILLFCCGALLHQPSSTPKWLA